MSAVTEALPLVRIASARRASAEERKSSRGSGDFQGLRKRKLSERGRSRRENSRGCWRRRTRGGGRRPRGGRAPSFWGRRPWEDESSDAHQTSYNLQLTECWQPRTIKLASIMSPLTRNTKSSNTNINLVYSKSSRSCHILQTKHMTKARPPTHDQIEP